MVFFGALHHFQKKNENIPIGSMYGIYIYAKNGGILMVNVCKCYHIWHTWILWDIHTVYENYDTLALHCRIPRRNLHPWHNTHPSMTRAWPQIARDPPAVSSSPPFSYYRTPSCDFSTDPIFHNRTTKRFTSHPSRDWLCFIFYLILSICSLMQFLASLPIPTLGLFRIYDLEGCRLTVTAKKASNRMEWRHLKHLQHTL